MKLKLKTSNAPSDAPAAPLAETPTPVSAKPGGLKLKLSSKPSTPALTRPPETLDGDTPKVKRKYTKKPKTDAEGNLLPPGKPGPKKRAREDGDDGEPPAGKRKSKPTAKSLAMQEQSDDEEEIIMTKPSNPAPRPLVARTQSIKIQLNPNRSGSTLLRVKGGGKPPVRPYGVGYDSEADEAEPDPAIESQFVLRMFPGPDCDLLRKAIEEKTIGKSKAQGGPGVQFRFFDREGRRAMITVNDTKYAATMVELPTVIESLKSWNKKDWVKTADVCQMLVVLGKVDNEEDAKKYPRPSYIEAESHRFPHGLTPPMRWVRKLRFKPRKSYIDVERCEAHLANLLEKDAAAEGGSKWAIVDSDEESSEESSSEEEDDEEMVEEPMADAEDDFDLEQMMHEGLVDEEVVPLLPDGDTLPAGSGDAVQAETPTTAHEVAMHALNQNGHMTLEPETAASTPAAATSADDDDDDDDDDGDSDEDGDEIDEAKEAEDSRKDQLRAEIAELKDSIARNVEIRDRQTNAIFRKRQQVTIDKIKADLVVKEKQLDDGADDD